MSTKPKISIVIPVYQGENSIGNLVDQLIDSLKERVDLEIMLVNDDYPDDSEAKCIGLHHKYPQIVKFISLAKNVGEHNAVMAGLNYCTGDGAIIMDDDFQNPVSGSIRIWDRIHPQYFLMLPACGVRLGSGSRSLFLFQASMLSNGPSPDA